MDGFFMSGYLLLSFHYPLHDFLVSLCVLWHNWHFIVGTFELPGIHFLSVPFGKHTCFSAVIGRRKKKQKNFSHEVRLILTPSENHNKRMLKCSFHVRFRQAASATHVNVYKKNSTTVTCSPTEKTLVLLLLMNILLQPVVLQREPALPKYMKSKIATTTVLCPAWDTTRSYSVHAARPD